MLHLFLIYPSQGLVPGKAKYVHDRIGSLNGENHNGIFFSKKLGKIEALFYFAWKPKTSALSNKQGFYLDILYFSPGGI